MKKSEYRTIYKNKRIELSEQERTSLDRDIYNQLVKIDLKNIRLIHVYISIQKFNEPDTLSFISFLKLNYPNIGIVISRSDFQNNVMINYLWDDNLLLKESKWGILEPQAGIIVEESQIDVVIVPLLVADKKGNRVGYGKGFYDRFLSKCKPIVRKIGISYFEPIEGIEDVNEFDIPLDTLITPTGIFDFK